MTTPNFYTPAWVRVWLRLDDDVGGDLNPRAPGAFDKDAVGTRPPWLEEELTWAGFDEIVSPEWRTPRCRWMTWALDVGVAPGQPFCVHIEEPEVRRVCWESDEWDIFWSWKIVDIAPLDIATAAKRWGDFLFRRALAFEQERREAFDYQRAALRAPMAVTIHWHARSSVTLRLVHEDAGAWRGWLAEGRGDGETVDAAIAEAWRSLEAATGLRYPTIDASKLRELRRIGW